MSFKYIKLYVLWILIYLPLIIFNYSQYDSSIFTSSITFVRKLLLTGSNPYSYHLWYLLEVPVACLLVYLRGRVNASVYLIWIIGLCFMFFGYWMENTTTLAGLFQKKIFETSNNGFTFGLGAFTTGMLLYPIKRYRITLAAIFLMILVFLYSVHGPFYSLLGGASIVLFSTYINLSAGVLYKKNEKLDYMDILYSLVSCILYYDFYYTWMD